MSSTPVLPLRGRPSGRPAPATLSPVRPFDLDALRADFPALRRRIRGLPLVYLDNAATTHKPEAVIDTISRFYRETNSNVHRGVHTLSQEATDLYEQARESVRRFLHAGSTSEIVFTRGTTESINLVAQTYGRAHIGAGDEIIVSTMEHHSNIVPWQMLCEQTGAVLRVIPITDEGELRMDEFERLLSPRTKLVSVVHVSNALGTINPVKRIIRLAHAAGVPVLLDGAQSVQHLPVDVRELDCDFYAFSGHKVYGPTGIGVLYGKERLLEDMPPYQGGGDMILTVSFERTVYNELPFKFEAGTPNIAGAVGLGAALDYLASLDMRAVAEHERDVLDYATARLLSLPELLIIGTAAEKVSVVSFMFCAVHPHDIGTILDQHGIAIRAGHHCAQPTMQRLNIPATARASFALYNTREDVDALVHGLEHVLQVFS
jgi:cysteine desulfurase / selenocysteine lyase